jgi:hypothetical protein
MSIAPSPSWVMTRIWLSFPFFPNRIGVLNVPVAGSTRWSPFAVRADPDLAGVIGVE